MEDEKKRVNTQNGNIINSARPVDNNDGDDGIPTTGSRPVQYIEDSATNINNENSKSDK